MILTKCSYFAHYSFPKADQANGVAEEMCPRKIVAQWNTIVEAEASHVCNVGVKGRIFTKDTILKTYTCKDLIKVKPWIVGECIDIVVDLKNTLDEGSGRAVNTKPGHDRDIKASTFDMKE